MSTSVLSVEVAPTLYIEKLCVTLYIKHFKSTNILSNFVLTQVFHWSRPCNRPYGPRVGSKSRRVVRKSAGKCRVGYEIPDRTVKLQTGQFCSRGGCRTSPKPLTDKPDHKQIGHKEKQTSQEHVPDPSRQD